MSKSFLVIGFGRFGRSITETLISLGHQVLVVDRDERRVAQGAGIATEAVQLDSTDEEALREIEAASFDEAIVAIGNDIQASILTTLLLKELGVSKVTAKANNEHHCKVLEKIGADRIVQPERDMGVRVAHNIVSDNVLDFIELTPEYSLMEVRASEHMDGKTLEELKIRAKYGCTVLAIKPEGEKGMNISPKASDVIRHKDILVIIGTNREISRLEQSLLIEK